MAHHAPQHLGLMSEPSLSMLHCDPASPQLVPPMPLEEQGPQIDLPPFPPPEPQGQRADLPLQQQQQEDNGLWLEPLMGPDGLLKSYSRSPSYSRSISHSISMSASGRRDFGSYQSELGSRGGGGEAAGGEQQAAGAALVEAAVPPPGGGGASASASLRAAAGSPTRSVASFQAAAAGSPDQPGTADSFGAFVFASQPMPVHGSPLARRVDGFPSYGSDAGSVLTVADLEEELAASRQSFDFGQATLARNNAHLILQVSGRVGGRYPQNCMTPKQRVCCASDAVRNPFIGRVKGRVFLL